MITTFYGNDLSYLPAQAPEWKKRYKKLFREGALFLTEGNFMKKSLIKLGCPEDKIKVQHLGVDLDKIPFAPKKLQPEETIKVLTAASFTEKKGISYAVEAFGRVKQSNPDLKIQLTVIGDSRGKTEEEKIKKRILNLIQEYMLGDYIRLLGYQPYNVWLQELSKNHIFIHPSLQAESGDTEGGAPVSIIEASAAGLPILSTTHCDIPEIVLDRQSGYLVPEKDTGALEEKLMFLISHPDIWEKLGRTGRSHIQKEYNIIHQSNRLKDIYDQILARPKNGR
jgi:colanic acid/amylovoran biosynthesis glycosyltransferase